MNILNIFECHLELTNENWFNELTFNSKFSLNGLKIYDSESQIDKSYNSNTFNNTEEDTRKIYRHPNFNNHYKVKNGIIIGFGLIIKDQSKQDFITKFGEPISEDILIGSVYGMYSYDVEGYDLVYNNFRLVMSPSKEKLESIQFGEKLLYWDK
ncbi:MAG: hypothetical protein ABI315_02130 [Bacteroidia bacterium]